MRFDHATRNLHDPHQISQSDAKRDRVGDTSVPRRSDGDDAAKAGFFNRVLLVSDNAEGLDFFFGASCDAEIVIAAPTGLVLPNLKRPKVDAEGMLRRINWLNQAAFRTGTSHDGGVGMKTSPSIERPCGLGTIRALIVENSEIDAELTVRMLEQFGFSVDWERVEPTRHYRGR